MFRTVNFSLESSVVNFLTFLGVFRRFLAKIPYTSRIFGGPVFCTRFQAKIRTEVSWSGLESGFTAMIPVQVSRSRHESSARIFGVDRESDQMLESSARIIGMFRDSDRRFPKIPVLDSAPSARIRKAIKNRGIWVAGLGFTVTAGPKPRQP